MTALSKVPWTVPFLWLAWPLCCGLLTPAFPSTDTGFWPLAHFLGRLCRVCSVLRNGAFQSGSLPCLFRDSRDQGMSGHSQFVSHKILWLGQNPLLGEALWHKRSAICSKICVRSTGPLPHRKCTETAKCVLNISEDTVCRLQLTDRA